MKTRTLTRATFLAVAVLSMGSLLAGTSNTDAGSPVSCGPWCNKSGCKLSRDSKDQRNHDEKAQGEEQKAAKEDCDQPCPAEKQARGEERDGAVL